MPTANRTHPGGVPAPTQPYTEVPVSGRVNFHRMVPQNGEQSEPADGISARENTTTPEEEMTIEEVKGQRYTFSSNIFHRDDDDVQVPDLSDINIDCQLEQETHDLLRETLMCDGTQKSAYSISQHQAQVDTEWFTVPSPFGDLRVCRKTYFDFDIYLQVEKEDKQKMRRQYTESATAKRISKQARENAGSAPTKEQVKYVACRILARNNHVLPKGVDRVKGPKLLHQAQAELFLHRNDATYQAELANEMNGAKPTDCTITPADVESVNDKLPEHSQNKFDQFLVDREAAKLCERIEGFDIFICRDKNHQLILVVFTEAVQKLLPAGTLEQMAEATQAAAWRVPIQRADPLRHHTNQAIHLAENPDKDVDSKQCKQPHFAVCGTEHLGAHHELGNYSGLERLCFQEFYVKSVADCKPVLNSSAWKVEIAKLITGLYGVTVKVSRMILKALDPQLYHQYLRVRENLPEGAQLTLAKTGDNPYGYMAHLIDVLTEGHTDSKDWEQGLASLTCFGDFTGGNLVLKELGLEIDFPSGSNCHLRGRELHHQITSYKGRRYCIVLTNKQSVRNTVPEIQKLVEEKMAEFAKLQEKDRKDWSEDETKLNEAAMKGKNAVLELCWKSKQDNRKRGVSKSKGDDPDQPPPKKKQKKSKSG